MDTPGLTHDELHRFTVAHRRQAKIRERLAASPLGDPEERRELRRQWKECEAEMVALAPPATEPLR
jgi:hypothetical protein